MSLAPSDYYHTGLMNYKGTATVAVVPVRQDDAVAMVPTDLSVKSMSMAPTNSYSTGLVNQWHCDYGRGTHASGR